MARVRFEAHNRKAGQSAQRKAALNRWVRRMMRYNLRLTIRARS